MQGIYNDEPTDWSSSATFTTLATTAPPFDLEATQITAHTATLNWTGIQDGYNVRYRTAEDRVTTYFTSFNENEDRSGWTGAGFVMGGTDDPIYGYPGNINNYLQMGWNTTDDAYLISPELPYYPSGCILKFNYFSAWSPSTFQVGYSTTTNDLSAFTWSDAITANKNAYSTTYNEVLPDGIKYVAFKTKAPDNDHIVFIDNFGLFVKDIPAGDWVEEYDVASPLPIANSNPSIGACRAYFELSDGQLARQFVLNFDGCETTAVFDLNINEQIINNNWYDLSGRKLDSKPTQKGVYINNGHKVVIK